MMMMSTRVVPQVSIYRSTGGMSKTQHPMRLLQPSCNQVEFIYDTAHVRFCSPRVEKSGFGFE